MSNNFLWKFWELVFFIFLIHTGQLFVEYRQLIVNNYLKNLHLSVFFIYEKMMHNFSRQRQRSFFPVQEKNWGQIARSRHIFTAPYRKFVRVVLRSRLLFYRELSLPFSPPTLSAKPSHESTVYSQNCRVSDAFIYSAPLVCNNWVRLSRALVRIVFVCSCFSLVSGSLEDPENFCGCRMRQRALTWFISVNKLTIE